MSTPASAIVPTPTGLASGSPIEGPRVTDLLDQTAGGPPAHQDASPGAAGAHVKLVPPALGRGAPPESVPTDAAGAKPTVSQKAHDLKANATHTLQVTSRFTDDQAAMGASLSREQRLGNADTITYGIGVEQVFPLTTDGTFDTTIEPTGKWTHGILKTDKTQLDLVLGAATPITLSNGRLTAFAFEGSADLVLAHKPSSEWKLQGELGVFGSATFPAGASVEGVFGGHVRGSATWTPSKQFTWRVLDADVAVKRSFGDGSTDVVAKIRSDMKIGFRGTDLTLQPKGEIELDLARAGRLQAAQASLNLNKDLGGGVALSLGPLIRWEEGGRTAVGGQASITYRW